MAKPFLFLASVLLFAATVAGAEPKWIRVPSTDFEIFSTAGEGSTMDVLHHFEEVRSFFTQTSGSGANHQAEPVRIVVFGSDKEYAPYRPSEAAAAFYTQIAGRDYIVLGGVSEDVFPIAVHEYVHLIAQHRGMNLPPWLNEGVADVYSTLKPIGKQILVGSLIKGHLYGLQQNSWIPLSTILAVDHNSPYYNEKKKAGNFYAESWALAHMLMLDPAYRPQFSKLLVTLRGGGNSQQVIESLYGKPLADFDKEVQRYIRGDRFSGGLVPAKLDGRADAHPEPAQPFDVKLALLDLLERPGKEGERRKGLTALAAEYPQRSEPHAALGYLAWRTNNQSEAVKEFKAAIDLGGRNPQMLWDYGRMAASTDAPDALRALNLLLSLDSTRMDVRLMVAELQLNGKDYREALATLSDVKQVTTADAPRLFRVLAITQMNNGAPDEAAITAKRWQDSAVEESDRNQATRLIEYLDASSRRAKQAAMSPAASQQVLPPSSLSAPESLTSETSGPPVLRRRDSPETTTSNASPASTPVLRSLANLPSVAGIFVEFDCTRPQPRFVLSTQKGNAAFVMDDPKLVFIRGRESDTIELNCGKQKESLPVWIEYAPPPSPANGALGIARIVHFEAPGAGAPGR